LRFHFKGDWGWGGIQVRLWLMSALVHGGLKVLQDFDLGESRDPGIMGISRFE
jgi:hypothetical protein